MIWEIVLTLFFLALIVLVVMLVPVVMQLRQSLTKFNQAMDTLNKDLPEVMSNVNDISKSSTLGCMSTCVSMYGPTGPS